MYKENKMSEEHINIATRALRHGIWIRVCNSRTDEEEIYRTPIDGVTTDGIIIRNHSFFGPPEDEIYPFTKYGKTWSLTKAKLGQL